MLYVLLPAAALVELLRQRETSGFSWLWALVRMLFRWIGPLGYLPFRRREGSPA